jgi:hypothetical protein
MTMNQYFTNVERWRIPQSVVPDSLIEMALDGRRNNEGIVLFLGRDHDDFSEVTHLVKLRGPHIKKYPDLINIEAPLLNEVADLASSHGVRLIGQVHTHGRGYSLNLSPTDRDYGIQAPFYLSLVAPDYALSASSLKQWGIHVFMENTGYVRLNPTEIDQRIELVAGAQLPFLTAGGLQ